MTKGSKRPLRKAVLIDTNSIAGIGAGRSNSQELAKELSRIGPNLVLSQMSEIELFYNINAQSTKAVEFIIGWIFKIPISQEIGQEAVRLVKRYPNKLKAADAVIAATARLFNLQLYTLNSKDFSGITGVQLYKPRTCFTD